MTREIAFGAAGLTGKVRSFWVGFGLSLVTFGLYGVGWYYLVNDELKNVGRATGDDDLKRSNPTASVVALVIGGWVLVPGLVSVYNYGQRIQRAQRLGGIPPEQQINPTTSVVLLFPGALLVLPYLAHFWYVTKHQNAAVRAVGGLALPSGAAHLPTTSEPAQTPGRRTDATTLPPPEFRVVALGPSGSGKTVFLASMFHHLNFTSPDRSYRLQADASQLITLGQLYDELSDTSQAWPAGTDQTLTEFRFDCVERDGRALEQPILRLRYLDYRGGLLTQAVEPGSTALIALEEKIRGAHAILAVLDGFRVRQLLRNEPEGHAYFQHKVRPMFGLMESASCPIHFVVTKWDLVRDVGEEAHMVEDVLPDEVRLHLVREALMRYDHIKGIVFKRRDQIVRLIPVSAVGREFGELDAQGNVVKRRDGEIRPKNVEVPLCAVVPDLFAQVERSLKDAVRVGIRDDERLDLRDRARVTVTSVLASVTNLGLSIALPAVGTIANDAMALFLGWIAASPTEPRPRRNRDGDESKRQLEGQRVREAVMADFMKSVSKLEATLPSSVLTTGT